jgi:hypothetical protein
MKSFIATFYFLSIWAAVNAQIDKKWIVGSPPVVINFETDTTTSSLLKDSLYTYIITSSTNICDSSGELLYFSNGMCLFDKNGDTIENAFGFHPPELSSFYGVANNTCQAIISLPKGDNKYYYIYFSMSDAAYLNNQSFDLMYYGVVDMGMNNGLGKSILNKAPLPTIPLQYLAPYGLTACKHANGRDWWVVRPGFKKNAYLTYLVTPDTITAPYYQEVEPGVFGGNQPAGQTVFSQQGDKYAHINYTGGIKLLDFDRCTGLFSNNITLTLPFDSTNGLGVGGNGASFSPSGRYLYANTFNKVYQFDLLSNDIQSSIMEVGSIDSSNFAWLMLEQIGPDGKIYICGFHGGINALNVIKHPEQEGTACSFEQISFTLNGTLSGNSLPNMPNYHLGALQGSECDTIINSLSYLTGERIDYQVYPNPTTGKIIFLYTNTFPPTAYITVHNLLGVPVFQTKIDNSDPTIDLSFLPAGNYFIEIRVKGKTPYTLKVVKVE